MKSKNPNPCTIYVIEKLECDSFERGITVGYCTSEESAIKMCKNLDKEHNERIDRWNEFCSNCAYEAVNFKSPDCKKAQNSLAKIKKSKCPFAKDVEFKELKINDKSAGFEICCKHLALPESPHVFITNKCERLD